MVEERWGDVVAIDGDPRLRWRHSDAKMPCHVCAQPMRRVINSAWIAHRCRVHGVWFVKDCRTYFERVHSDDIKRYLAARQEVADLVRTIQDAVANDPRAVHTLAMRLLRVEHRVTQLNEHIAQLEETIRSQR